MAAKTKADEERGCCLCPVPGCDGALLEGPSGGMSINVKCDTCERKWNLAAVIHHMEPID